MAGNILIIHYKKKVICNKVMQVCCDNIYKTIETICPKFKNSINGHISITHSKPLHDIQVCLYTKGKHEFLRDGKETISTKFNDMQETYTGTVPTKTELEKL